MRKALLLAAVLAAAMAPAAQARPTIVVQASAVGVTSAGVLSVQFQCSAADITGGPVVIETCGFGPLYAAPSGGTAFAFTSGSGALRQGGSRFLCVVASTPGTTQNVTRCAAYDPLTGTAVVAG
jgi:hypothetical protein